MSIAAGYGIAAIREGIGRDAGIIRIMPNVNANVCASTTGYATSASITAAQLDAFHFAFGKIGELIELDESEFETFSAMAGCGPLRRGQAAAWRMFICLSTQWHARA